MLEEAVTIVINAIAIGMVHEIVVAASTKDPSIQQEIVVHTSMVQVVY